MPENTNACTHPATRRPQAVPDPTRGSAGRTTAEDKLWSALHAHPGTTTADLATHAGIGRSTAGKILVAWAGDGSAIRTPASSEGGRRKADTWAISDSTANVGAEPAVCESPTELADGSPQATDTADGVVGEENEAGEQDAAVQSPDTEAPPQHTSAATAAASDTEPARGRRLAKGALRGMVEDFLTEHPAEQFSPSAIGKALKRSPGAVANALDKLVTDGYVICAQDKPKRYATTATAGSPSN